MWKVLSILMVFCAGPVLAQQAADAVEPEASGAGAFEGLPENVMAALAAKDAGQPVKANDWMIAAANPHAVKAGADVLAAGGTAADALVAVQVVLGLVEPQSSGLGGGAFLIWYDAASGSLTTLDGRETAPLEATPQLFQDEAGEPLKFFDAVVGGRSVGTPGTPALLAEVHARWGNQDWASLLEPARVMAEQGFAVSPRLAALVDGDRERLSSSKVTADYFMPAGVPVVAGDILKNPGYAVTLETYANEGAKAFYGGRIGREIVATVRTADNPGVLSETDMAIYQVKERAPVCAPYRAHEVCGMGPPSSGAVAVGQILAALEGFDLSAGPQDPTVRMLIGDASRLAFADRGRYLADSDYVPVPVSGLLDPEYMQERAAVLGGDTALESVEAGNPDWDHALLWADDESIELPSTSHISIVDAKGNVASMTTTIENAFGSRLMVGGFLLNNELTDFSFRSQAGGVPIANRVEPSKRPRSSMAPTIVLKDGAPVMAVGSPGGSRIIGYVAQTIIGVIDWGLDVQQAVSVPHAVNRFGTYDLEEGTEAAALEEALGAMGYEVGLRSLTSGLHVIAIGNDLQGGADPRREGVAVGQ
ncbi:Gamma-glutamyltransferase [Sulfitobacter noctilucicola]|uniref:Glutathione hydrolase proenzyme n=1 Tax=Sulfitobacter noctilucicola TaxID=1342301 RepID=A0A7W6MA90_9RHOB|nr:gamma-glutamyltransferase [Sulfitobacter noctilucicola]KIN63616.1 Gamma-glutamyltransferase [Sulfitobacter noctilucicola]MBB4174873.1 gamma-glutamyltranspeptidase/glutathione hydrolase [Sulfitobacter noctilucicola]